MAFNPMILDASLLNVSSCLSDEDKVDVLLYALQKIHFESRSRTLIENAAQSCFQVSTSPVHLVRARVLRAKARLAAGSSLGAQQDLQAALMIDPDDLEAKALVQQRPPTRGKSPMSPHHASTGRERFSAEVWREIAALLPRRDQKTLLFVPHIPSRVASQLLFRNIDLHFGGTVDGEQPHLSEPHSRDDAWHAQRSADILTRIIQDSGFATLVKSLRIFAASHEKGRSIAFQAGFVDNTYSNTNLAENWLTGILANAVPKLINLRRIHCSASSGGLNLLLQAWLPASRYLREMSLVSTDRPADLHLLEFKQLTQISYESTGGNPAQVLGFIAQNRHSLRSIKLHNKLWNFPSNTLSIRNLTRFDFLGCFTDSQAFCGIFLNGHQLEFLGIKCFLNCVPSSQLRAIRSCLPFLRHFGFTVFGIHHHITDRDLFPALAEFLRNRTQLRSLQFSVPDPELHLQVGFDASAWGVLPSLVNLRNLGISYPRDLSPGLASWLIPRSVRALSLDSISFSGRDSVSFLTQIRAGVPPSLHYVGLAEFPSRKATTVVIDGFPMVHVLRVGNTFWTVVKKEGDTSIDLEQWPQSRVKHHTAEWLQWLGCEDVLAGSYSL